MLKITKMLTVVLAVSALAVMLTLYAGAARAALLAHETFESEPVGAFDYTADQAWAAATPYGYPASMDIVGDKDLSYSGGEVSIPDGNRALRLNSASSRGQGMAFTFAAQTGTIYFSVLAETTSGNQVFVGVSANVDRNCGMGVLDMDTEPDPDDVVGGHINRGAGGDRIYFGDGGDAIGTPIFFVGKVSKSGANGDKYDTLDFSVNPTSVTEGAWDATGTQVMEATSISFCWVGFGWDFPDGDSWLDEIRVGTEYGDVVVPEPATLALLGLGGLGLVLRRKRS